MARDLIVFVPVGTRVRYAETRYLTEATQVVIFDAAHLKADDSPIPQGYRDALNAEPVFDAQRYVDTDKLLDRLMHAEHVCAMYGWCAVPDLSYDRAAAAQELWMIWADHVRSETGNPDFPTPEDFRYLNDDMIAELAANRRATVAATNARIDEMLTAEALEREPDDGPEA